MSSDNDSGEEYRQQIINGLKRMIERETSRRTSDWSSIVLPPYITLYADDLNLTFVKSDMDTENDD